MEEVTLQDIVDAVQGIDVNHFLAKVDAFVGASECLHLKNGLSTHRQAASCREQNETFQHILHEAARLQTCSTLAVSRIANFHFRVNSQAKRTPSAADKTPLYFRKLRKYQIELLLSIENEIGLIRECLKQSFKIQQVFRENVPPVAQASRYLAIVQERIAARPTTLLKLNGKGKKIEQLNSTFLDIQRYEDACQQEFRHDAESNPIAAADAILADLTTEAHHDMEYRKGRLKDDIRELAKGRKLMIKLATKGYSPFMKKNLDILVACHGERIRRFNAAVRKSRRQYYIEALR